MHYIVMEMLAFDPNVPVVSRVAYGMAAGIDIGIWMAWHGVSWLAVNEGST